MNELNNKQNESADLKKVGLVSDAHGIRGEIYVVLFSGDNSWIDRIKTITLQSASTENTTTVLKIKKIKAFKKGFICSLQGFATRNQAEEIKKMEVWIDSELLISADGDLPFLSELLDFTVIDSRSGPLGTVIGFSSNGVQDLLVLSQQVNSQNIEIPFIKEFVTDVDYKLKKITTALPEGLIEINEKD